MNASEAKTGQKQIQDLRLREVDIVYSLMRLGDWPDSEISRVYKLSVCLLYTSPSPRDRG